MQPKLNSYEVFWNRKRPFSNGGLCVTTRHCTLESTGWESSSFLEMHIIFQGFQRQGTLEFSTGGLESGDELSFQHLRLKSSYTENSYLDKSPSQEPSYSFIRTALLWLLYTQPSKPPRIRIQSRCEKAQSGDLFAISDCIERLLGLWGNAQGLLGPLPVYRVQIF